LILTAFQGSALADELSCFHFKAPPLSKLLLKPSCCDGAETRAELAELQALETLRSEEQEQRASDDYHRNISRFLAGMGFTVGEEQLGDAGHLFSCVYQVVEEAVEPAKKKFKRTRPYKLPDNGLHPLKEITEKDSYSYPSGHAAYGAAVGFILIEMVPELREKIYGRVKDFGFSRLVSGVHFRSDVYAGEIAGAAIAASLRQNEEFRRDFERAKVSLRKALGY